jgi:hypothetical protein
MANPHSLTFYQDAARRDVFQLLQQTRSKPLPATQILELLGIGEATYPVAEEDQVILFITSWRVVVLGAPKWSRITLKPR